MLTSEGFVASIIAPEVYPMGTTIVTWIVEDIYGNVSTCQQNVTVEDKEGPTALCNSFTIQLDSEGSASIDASMVDNGSFDNCSAVTSTIDVTDFSCEDVGPNSVILTVSDLNGNSSTCEATITVEDNVDPVAICADVLTIVLDEDGLASISVEDIDMGSFDACGIASTTIDVSNFDCGDVGENTVTLTVIDNNGNESSCTTLVTVEDNSFPTFEFCPDDQIVEPVDGTCFANVVWDVPEVYDNCEALDPIFTADGASITVVGNQAIASFPSGVTVVTMTVEDEYGNETSCTFSITVPDNEAPIISGCPTEDIVVSTEPGECMATVLYGVIIATDNCDEVTLEQTSGHSVKGDLFYIGVTEVLFTATDASGLQTTCSFTVTVIDSEPASFACPADVTQSADEGSCGSFTVDLGEAIATDNCEIIEISNNGLEYYPVGTTTVTWTAIDAQGNEITCEQTVTITDDEAPMITCPDDVVIGTDADDCAATNVNLGIPSLSDNCGLLMLDDGSYASNDAPAEFLTGTTIVTWTVVDIHGNQSTCEQSVTIQDLTDPVANCTDITIQLDGTGNATIDVSDINAGSFDNCGAISMILSQETFDCSHIGTNDVFLTVTDDNGNESSCTATVTIEDVQPAEIICPADVLASADIGTCVAAGLDIGEATVVDLCTGGILSNDAPEEFSVGTTIVTWTYIDANGNITSCTQNVIVEDNQHPIPEVAELPDIIANCDVTLTPPTAIDNCDGSLTGETLDPIFYDEPGTYLVSWEYMDSNGNLISQIQTVIIENGAPIAICTDITVALDIEGSVSIEPFMVDGGSTNDCGGISLSIDQSDFDCSNLGANTITLTVTDDFGNESTCTATVTVEDNISPEIYCADITVELGENETASITPEDLEGIFFIEDDIFTSYDACGYALSASMTEFDCSHVGDNIVILTATDGSGNASSCEAIVTIVDLIATDIVCLDTVLVLDAIGLASLEAEELIDLTSLNDCAYEFSIDQTDFNCEDVGDVTVTLTATDDSGNESICQAIVSVTDITAPDIICQDITVILDDDGLATITPEELEGIIVLGDGDTFTESFDACGYTLAASQTDFSCDDLGNNIVILTATDSSGNTSTCEANVEVVDITAPVVECMKLIATLDPATGTISIDPSFYDNGSTDGCGLTFSASQTDFDCSHIGNNMITVTVTDESGNSSTCLTAVVIQGDPCELQYCESKGLNSEESWIQRIIYSAIHNDSGDNGGYEDFTSISTDMQLGVTDTIFLKAGYTDPSNLAYWRVWIDFNQDGVFNPSTEKVAQRRGLNEFFRLISIPSDAQLGETKMRVSMKVGSYPQPCETFAFGEVEDYTVNIIDITAAVETAEENESTVNEDEIPTEIQIEVDTRETIQDFEVTLYPNPSYNETFLKIDTPSTINLEMSVYDHLGRLVVEQQLIDEELTRVDVSALPPGKYFMKLSGKDGVIVKNFIVLSN